MWPALSTPCAARTRPTPSHRRTWPRPRRAQANLNSRVDFRDHLTTADSEGRRQWLYPRKVHGRFYRGRTWLSWLLLAVMFAGPFVRITGNPLLLFNIVERKFIILGPLFWPQDMSMGAVALLIVSTSILGFTAADGRRWCGWTCPQTVLMEMVFRKIEYFIEGDWPQQAALAQAPWTSEKVRKK